MNVPVDIVVDILSRLPVKSLIAYKSVCKLWNTTIASDPSLIELHLQRSKLEPHHHHHVLPTIYLLHQFVLGTTYYSAAMLTVYNDQQQQQHRQTAAGATASKLKPLLEINFFCPNSLCFRLLGSCNGFLCFYGFQHFETKSSAIILSNPATKQYHILPESFVDGSSYQVVLGFGCQEVSSYTISNDYKVVKIIHSNKSNKQPWYAIEVYSLQRGSWTFLGDDVVPPRTLDIRMAMEANHVFVLGCAHWLATTKGWAETNKKMYKLLSFNMADEMFRVIAAPDSFESVKNKRAYIGLLEGCVSMCMGRPYWKCEVWVMRDYDDVESWEKVH